MGRVRRYKAIKACDPFSKKKGRVTTIDNNHDDPPDLFEKKRRKKARILAKREDLSEHDQFAASDYEKAIAEQEKRFKATAAPTIEPMRKDETLREFQKRVRDQTRKTLLDEIPKLRKSAVRRKEKMKELKAKKKQKTERDDFQDASVISIRPHRESEAIPTPTPMATTHVAFGERMTEPPNLNAYVASLQKAAEKAKAKAKTAELASKGAKLSPLQRQFV